MYRFNAKLRGLLFALIEDIEISLRTNVANYFSLKYGSFGFEDLTNFARKEDQARTLEEIYKEIARNKRSPFIKNFQRNYEDGAVPLYAAVEVMSFGTLSKLYKNMKNEDKDAIAKRYDNMNHFYFESFIESFSYLRNVCSLRTTLQHKDT